MCSRNRRTGSPASPNPPARNCSRLMPVMSNGRWLPFSRPRPAGNWSKFLVGRGILAYILRFVILGWAAIAACAGVVIGLAHLLKDTTLTIIVVQFVVYSCAFGFMGWQHYKSRDKREGWHFDEQE